MKKPPPSFMDEEMSKDLEQQILKRTAPQLFALRGKSGEASYRRRVFALLFAGGLMAAAAVVVLNRSQMRGGLDEPAMNVAVEFEMLERMDLLRDMQMLQSEDLLNRVKGKKGWPKARKRS